MLISMNKKGKEWQATITNGDERQTVTFKTQQEAQDYQSFIEKLGIKKTKPKRVTRLQASIAAFKQLNEEGVTKDQLVRRANEIYVKDGGADNPEEQTNYVNWTLKFLKDLEEGYTVPKINLASGLEKGEVLSIQVNK